MRRKINPLMNSQVVRLLNPTLNWCVPFSSLEDFQGRNARGKVCGRFVGKNEHLVQKGGRKDVIG
jgi:hypothetical protein